MNILVASVDAFPSLGGVSVMSHSLSSALVEQGHRLVFVGPRGSYVPSGFERDYHFYEDWESEVRKRAGADGRAQDARIRALFVKLMRRYAIDRALLMHPFYYGVGALDAGRDVGVGCSVYFHGFELRSQLQGNYPSDLAAIVGERRLNTLRERIFYTIARADEVLVNSRYTASLFQPFSIKPRVRITGCGIPARVLERETEVSPAYSREVREQRRAELGLPRQTCLAYVGRLVATKRIDRLLAMCKHERELSALIIGSGPDEARLHDIAADATLDGRVTFAGQASEEQKWTLLRAADFLCLLSEPDEAAGQVEGFGIALLEGAAAAAVPVSSGSGGMTDVVQHLSSGLVLSAPDDVAARELLAVARDEARMNAMVATARAQLRSRFTWSEVARLVSQGWIQ